MEQSCDPIRLSVVVSEEQFAVVIVNGFNFPIEGGLDLAFEVFFRFGRFFLAIFPNTKTHPRENHNQQDGDKRTKRQLTLFSLARPFFVLLVALTMCALLWPWILGYAVPVSIRASALLGVGFATACVFTEDRRVHGVIGVSFLLGTVWALAVRFQVGAFTPK